MNKEVENMCYVNNEAKSGPAPIPQNGEWTQAKEIKDISGLTHGIGWCAPQQGACKLTLNIKDGIIEEALVETIGCSGMTHSAAMAGEILVGKTILEALNTDLVCDAINTAMRELFLQIVYGRSQSAFSENADCVLPYTICKNNSLIAVLIASHTKSVFNASKIVFPTSISPAIAAECVIPEHPIVSTNAS